jgi:hypothetical protein
MLAMKRFKSRAHAVDALRNTYGQELREMSERGASLAEMQDVIRRGVDLADLPKAQADLYETSDRAWRRFLNDIIRAAGVWDARPVRRL